MTTSNATISEIDLTNDMQSAAILLRESQKKAYLEFWGITEGRGLTHLELCIYGESEFTKAWWLVTGGYQSLMEEPFLTAIKEWASTAIPEPGPDGLFNDEELVAAAARVKDASDEAPNYWGANVTIDEDSNGLEIESYNGRLKIYLYREGDATKYFLDATWSSPTRHHAYTALLAVERWGIARPEFQDKTE